MKLRKLSIFIWTTLLFICVLYFFKLSFLSVDIFKAVPNQTALIIECNEIESLYKLNTNSPLWNAFHETALFEKIQTELNELNVRLLKVEEANSLLENSHFIAALQKSSAKSFDFLYIIDAEELQLDHKSLLEKVENAKISQSVYLKEKVHELVFADNQRFTICFYDDIMLFARFPFIVEDAIAQLKNPENKLYNKKGFRLAKKVNERKPAATVYFNFKSIPQLFDHSIQADKLIQLKPLGSMATINFYVNEDSVQVDGVFAPDSNIAFKSGTVNPLESTIYEVIPDNCSFVFWQSGSINNVKEKEQIKGAVFENYIKPWIGDECLTFLTESQNSSLDDEQFLALKAKDIKLAIKYLNKYADSKGEMQEIDYQTFTIKQLFSNDLIRSLSVFDINSSKSTFYTIIKDCVIFSSSTQSLEVLIDKHILNQTLSNHQSFLEFQQELLPSSNTFFYCNISLLDPFLKQFRAALEHENINEVFDILYMFKSLGVHFEKSDNQSELHFYFNSKGDQTRSTKIIWTAHLNANAIIQPVVLRNTINNQNEIFIQDEENQIYLFDRNGKEIWNRKLRSPILSKVYQIQYDENGENQILFNTKNRIYLMDHNGKDIGVYPIKLPSPATNGLCLIDFENDKQYRYFIGTQNGSVYAFEKTGEPIEAWNPKENVGKLVHDMQHFQVSGNDFIFALNAENDFHVFKRNGEKRFETLSFDGNYLSPPGVQIFDKSVRIVLANQFGKAQIFNLNGDYFNLYIGTGKDKNIKFLFTNVIGDHKKDYISLSGRDLSCYYYDKNDFKKSFSIRFEQAQDELFNIQIDENQKSMIGTLNKTNKRISLLQSDGSFYDGFPLSGSTKFSIVDLFDTESKVLVVALENSVYSCYID